VYLPEKKQQSKYMEVSSTKNDSKYLEYSKPNKFMLADIKLQQNENVQQQ
jgi:hypothetical protein